MFKATFTKQHKGRCTDVCNCSSVLTFTSHGSYSRTTGTITDLINQMKYLAAVSKNIPPNELFEKNKLGDDSIDQEG
jgi:hypothetical protein